MFASMLPWGISNSAEPLGRLFFTPEQRNALDAGKQVSKPRAATAAPRALKLNGVVTRSDNETTVWVNGRTVGNNGTSAAGVAASAADPAAARVKLRGMGTQVKLRVGQSLDRSTGKVTEAYESAAAGRSAPNSTRQKSVAPLAGKIPSSDETAEPSDQHSDRAKDD
jgi:hypothetical protein